MNNARRWNQPKHGQILYLYKYYQISAGYHQNADIHRELQLLHGTYPKSNRRIFNMKYKSRLHYGYHFNIEHESR